MIVLYRGGMAVKPGTVTSAAKAAAPEKAVYPSAESAAPPKIKNGTPESRLDYYRGWDCGS